MSPQTLVIRDTQHTAGFCTNPLADGLQNLRESCSTAQVKLCASIESCFSLQREQTYDPLAHAFAMGLAVKQYRCVPLEITKLRCDTVSKCSDSGMLCL